MSTEHAEPVQRELALPAPELSGDLPLVPVRMVNEYVYCPRLAYLEWVQGEWADSGDTEKGRRAHVRVDKPAGKLPEPAESMPASRTSSPARSRSSSEPLGIIAKMDLVEGEDGRGHAGGLQEGQATACRRGRLRARTRAGLRAGADPRGAGYKVAEGAICIAGSRERVRVALDEELRAMTRAAITVCGSSPLRAGCRRRWWTARNARDARSPASACPTRSTFLRRGRRRVRAPLASPGQRCRSTCRSAGAR